MTINEFIPTPQEIQHLIARRAEWARNIREYGRFYDLYDFRRYSQRFGQHWYDENTMSSFSSKIGACYHGESPADWNLFVSSERDSWSKTPRRYTVHQLQIDGSTENLSDFGQYTTSKQAARAIEKYLKDRTPF